MAAIPIKTQNGPPCCGTDRRDRTTGLEHVCRMVGLTLYRCSDKMRCPGRAQAAGAEVADPPGRDFVNALGHCLSHRSLIRSL